MAQPDGLPFSCRVTNEQGQIVPGALVLAPRFGTSFAEVLVSRTDENGSAVFQQVPQTRPPQMLTVWKDGYTLLTRRLTATEMAGAAPNLQVRNTRPLRVQVLDRNLLPVKDAEISFYRRYRNGDASSYEAGAYIDALKPHWRPVLRTDENGSTILPWAADGDSLRVRIEKAGYQLAEQSIFVSNTAKPILRLLPEARLRGRLLDEQGKPLPNVELSALPGPRGASTGSDGRFIVDRLGPRVTTLSILAEGLAFPPKAFQLRSGLDMDLGDIRLKKPGILTGKVSVAKSKPQITAWYRYSVIARPVFTGSAEEGWPTTVRLLETGGFELRLFPGKYKISVVPSGVASNKAAAEQEIEVISGATTTQNLVLN